MLRAFTFLLLLFPAVAPADAPPLMLATRWDPNVDPTGWWMSEKYDGVRGYWDGARMWTRQGEPIAIPGAFRAVLPEFPLDGELWAGRGGFERTTATVRDRTPGPGWSSIRYMVFDAPSHAGPFEERMAAVEAWLRGHRSPKIEVVVQQRCQGKAHLRAFLREAEQRGGEGVMLRAAGSLHVAGRSDLLRKYKSFDDTEAVVRGYKPGQGKYAGMVGSLQMELPDGKRFAIGAGLTDRERRTPPPIGSLVTFKHQGWTAEGKPRFPVYWRIRELPQQSGGLPAQVAP
jgi:DNA ligase-1